MKSISDLLAMTVEGWRALDDNALAEWATVHFAATRPDDKQIRSADVLTKLKKAGINPKLFKESFPDRGAKPKIKGQPATAVDSGPAVDWTGIAADDRARLELVRSAMDPKVWALMFDLAKKGQLPKK